MTNEITQRVDELEAQVDELQDVVSVDDSEGRTVTLPTLTSLGLTRRQALQALGMIAAGGMTMAGAVQRVTAADTTSGRFAAKVMQTQAVHDQNDNVAIDLPGDGSISVGDLDIAGNDFVASGDFLPLDLYGMGASATYSTTSTTYDTTSQGFGRYLLVWSDVIPTNAQGAVSAIANVISVSAKISIRVQNFDDGETVLEKTGISTTGPVDLGLVSYTPTTTGSPIRFVFEIRSSDGNTVELGEPTIRTGVQL